MPIYDGVVTLDETDVPVAIELDDDHVRLSASGTEIGQWATDECRIAHVTDTVYTITAEDETLQFVPNQPSLFAAAVNGNGTKLSQHTPVPHPKAATEATVQREAPPPKPLTLGLFYVLCLVTAALALWSLISIVSGG